MPLPIKSTLTRKSTSAASSFALPINSKLTGCSAPPAASATTRMSLHRDLSTDSTFVSSRTIACLGQTLMQMPHTRHAAFGSGHPFSASNP